MTQKLLGFVGLHLTRIPRHRLGWKSGAVGRHDLKLPDYYSVETIIDVGVAGGTPWLYEQFPTQNLLLVEPLNVVSQLRDILNGRNYEMYECAAGAVEGEVEINLDTTLSSLSSIKKRTELTARGGHSLERRKVPIKTLDSLMDQTSLSTEKLGLKIDTEGFELEVLKGATRTLTTCQFVVCEASIEKRFEDSYEFSELIVFMAEHGFSLKKVLCFSLDGNDVIRMADVLFEPT